MARWDLTKKKDIEKIQKRVRSAYKKFAKGLGDPEDAAQAILVRMLEGKSRHQTIDQAVIDYLRSTYGDTRLPSYAQRQNLERAYHVKSRDLEQLLPVDTGGAGLDRVDFERVLRLFPRAQQASFKLYYGNVLSALEIADLFGVSESRVSQWNARIQECISARIKAQDARDAGAGAGQVARVLRPETERQLWGMGEITFERMETGESFSVESFNETSF